MDVRSPREYLKNYVQYYLFIWSSDNGCINAVYIFSSFFWRNHLYEILTSTAIVRRKSYNFLKCVPRCSCELNLWSMWANIRTSYDRLWNTLRTTYDVIRFYCVKALYIIMSNKSVLGTSNGVTNAIVHQPYDDGFLGAFVVVDMSNTLLRTWERLRLCEINNNAMFFIRLIRISSGLLYLFIVKWLITIGTFSISNSSKKLSW